MKMKSTRLALAAMLTLGASAHATNLYWDGNNSTTGAGTTPTGIWGTNSYWNTDSLGGAGTFSITPTSLDDLLFSAGTDATGSPVITLSADQIARGITCQEGAVTLKGDGTARTLTLGSGGITMASTSGAVTLGDGTAANNLLLSLASGQQTWTNSSANAFTINNTAASISRSTTRATLTFNKASTGNFAISTTVAPLVNNIIGPWSFYGTGASTTYATIVSGNVAGLGYTGGADGTTAAASTNVTDTTGAVNYTLGAVGTLGANASINTLRYTGGAGSLANSGTFTTNGLLNAAAVNLQFTNDITIGSTNELVVNVTQSTGTITFNGAVGGAAGAGFTKTGAGNLIVVQTATFTGDVNLNEGSITMSTNKLFATGVNMNIASGAAWYLNGSSQTLGKLTGSGTVGDTWATSNADTLTVGSGNVSSQFDGIIAGGNGSSVRAIALTKTGSGTLTLTGANTYTGDTIVNGGTLNINNRGAANSGGLSVSGVGSILNIAASLTMPTSKSFSVGSSGSGSVTGTVNHTSGTVTVASNTGNMLLINGGGVYNLNGGTLKSGNTSTNRGVIIGVNTNNGSALAPNTFNLQSGTLDLNTNNAILQVGRSDSGASTTFNLYNQIGGDATVDTVAIGGKSGGSSSVTSTFNVTGGTFLADNFTYLANGSSDNVTMLLGSTAQVTLPAFGTTGGRTGTANLTLDFTSGYLAPKAASAIYMPAGTFNNAYLSANGAKFNVGFDITIGQVLSNKTGEQGTLTKTGGSNLTLTGANQYTGATTIKNGKIILGGGDDRLATSGTVVLGDTGSSGVLVLGDGTARNQTLAGLTASGNGGAVVGGAGTDSKLTLNIASTNTFSGVLGGSNANENNLALEKTGNGTLELTAPNTYTGGTTITGGTIQMGHSGALGSTGTIAFNGPASGTLSILKWGTGITTDLSSRITVNATKTAVLDTNGNDVNFASALTFTSGNGQLYKEGTGKLTLNSGFTLSRTDINGGTLKVAAGNYDLASYLTVNSTGTAAAFEQTGGTVNLTSSNGLYVGNYNNAANPSSTFTLSGGAFNVNGTQGITMRYTGNAEMNISGSGALSATGTSGTDGGLNFTKTAGATNSATFNLGDGSTFSGGTNINDGGTSGTFTTSRVNYTSGTATFNFNGGTLKSAARDNANFFGSANINAYVKDAGGIIDNSGQAIGISQAFQHGGVSATDGGIVFKGAGTTTLTGSSTYTGATTVAAGVLAVNGSLGATTVNVTGGTLQGEGTIAGDVTVQSGGTLAAGNSIESLGVGGLDLKASSTFSVEIDRGAAAGSSADLTYLTAGTLSIANDTRLKIAEIGTSGTWALGTRLTLIAYTGTWSGGLFDYYDVGNTLTIDNLADGATIYGIGGRDWIFNYDDTTEGQNYTGNTTTQDRFVTITAIPEPSATALGLLAAAGLMLRRRRD